MSWTLKAHEKDGDNLMLSETTRSFTSRMPCPPPAPTWKTSLTRTRSSTPSATSDSSGLRRFAGSRVISPCEPRARSCDWSRWDRSSTCTI